MEVTQELLLRAIVVASLLYMAYIGWMVHSRVNTSAGSCMLFIALMCQSLLTLCPWETRAHHDVPAPVYMRHIDATRLALTPTSLHLKFVGARSGRMYHEPHCHYVNSIVGPVWYASEEQAAADGKQPCVECITHGAQASRAP